MKRRERTSRVSTSSIPSNSSKKRKECQQRAQSQPKLAQQENTSSPSLSGVQAAGQTPPQLGVESQPGAASQTSVTARRDLRQSLSEVAQDDSWRETSKHFDSDQSESSNDEFAHLSDSEEAQPRSSSAS